MIPPAAARLDEVTGITSDDAQAIIAEIGLDMNRFSTVGHLVSRARISPRTIQSAPAAAEAKLARANPTSKASSVKPQRQLPAPTRS